MSLPTLSICRECKSKDYIHCWLSKTLHQAFLEILRLGEGWSFLQIHSLWRCLVQSQFNKCYLLGKYLKKWRNYAICSFYMLILSSDCAVFSPLTILRLCFIAWLNFKRKMKMAFQFCSTFRRYFQVVLLNLASITTISDPIGWHTWSNVDQLKFIRLALFWLYLHRFFWVKIKPDHYYLVIDRSVEIHSWRLGLIILFSLSHLIDGPAQVRLL